MYFMNMNILTPATANLFCLLKHQDPKLDLLMPKEKKLGNFAFEVIDFDDQKGNFCICY